MLPNNRKTFEGKKSRALREFKVKVMKVLFTSEVQKETKMQALFFRVST